MRVSKLKLLILVAMSLFGLWASGTVVVVYYYLNQTLPFCPSTELGWGIVLNCGLVLSSSYSQIFGVPLELLAVAYFVINLALVYLIAFGRESILDRVMDVLFVWRFIGLLIVPYLVFVELFLLKAICLYCTIMHVAIVLDFVVISYLLFYKGGTLYGSAADEEGESSTPKVSAP